jgi:steroid Delta-isomerase
MSQSSTDLSPALAASHGSWRAVNGRDRAGWLALMADDVLVEDPIGPGTTNSGGTGVRGKAAVGEFWDATIAVSNTKVTCEETFPSSSPDEIAHILSLHFEFDGGHWGEVRGVFTYRLNGDGLLTNMRGYWNMDVMQFGKTD